MSGTKAIAVIAGATLGLAHGALAQSEVDQSRALQAEMIQDAGARASYAQGDLSPTVWGQIQIRWTANNRDDPANDDEEFTHGFTNRRTKIGVRGGNDQWGYRVNGGFSSMTGNFRLEDAWVDYAVNESWTVTVGQFKLPAFYEESVSSSKQLAADRSLANEMFNQDRSQGIMATWDNGENFRVQLAFSDGITPFAPNGNGTANTDFNSPSEADFALTGRVDWKDGDWMDLDDFTSEANGNQALRIGGFGHYEDGGSTGGPTMDDQLWILGVDGQWESNGWSAFGSVAWIHSEPDMGDEADDIAFVLQGAYRFDQQDEVFARGSAVLLDDRDAFDTEDQIELLIGYNHYFDGHATKFTLDAGVFLEPSTDTIVPENTAVGILPDNGDPQFAVRAQLQVLF